MPFDDTPPAEPLTQPGDIWLLGRHRLLCGDATNPDDVALLMDGKKADLCVTDPPYNCAIIGKTKDALTIMNDKMDSASFYGFLFAAFKNTYENLVDGGAIYIFHSDAEKVNFYNATVAAGFHYSATCVWVKNAMVIGRMNYFTRSGDAMMSKTMPELSGAFMNSIRDMTLVAQIASCVSLVRFAAPGARP